MLVEAICGLVGGVVTCLRLAKEHGDHARMRGMVEAHAEEVRATPNLDLAGMYTRVVGEAGPTHAIKLTAQEIAWLAKQPGGQEVLDAAHVREVVRAI